MIIYNLFSKKVTDYDLLDDFQRYHTLVNRAFYKILVLEN